MFPILLLAQAQKVTKQTAGKVPAETTLGDFLALGVFGALVLMVVAVAAYYIRRAQQQLREQEEQWMSAEMAFEQQALEAVQARSGPPAPPPLPARPEPPEGLPSMPGSWPSAAPALPRLDTPPDAASQPAAPEDYGPRRFDAPPANLDELAKRLKTLGILADQEGKIPMPIPPDAPIFRLKKGGIVVLLPRIESEAFMAHQCKRFDMVIAMTATGEVLVLSRLQNRISELLDNPGDFEPNMGHLLGRRS